MTIIGKPNGNTRPVAVLEGPVGRIPIAGFQCSYCVGQLPTCRVNVAPEALNRIEDEQTNQVYQVLVGDGEPRYTIFRGYLSGEGGHVGGADISASLDLVHLGRDLDQIRISAPSLHPSSVLDFNYTFCGNSSSGAGSESGFVFAEKIFFEPGGDRLVAQIIKGIISILEETRTNVAQGVGGDRGVKIEAFDVGIQLLKKLVVLNGTLRGAIAGPLSNDNNNSINTWCHSRVEGSFNGVRSCWDTITSIISELGFNLVCDNQGTVYVMADVSGFQNLGGNYLGPDYITSFDQSSGFQRNIREVNLISDQIRADMTTIGGAAGSLATYPQSSDEAGASLAIQMPGWLNPIASTGSSLELSKAQVEFARSLYHTEKNKLRTAAIIGPLAPLVVPGTTAIFEPYSKMRAYSGQKIDNFSKQYLGYCYQVNHFMDPQAKQLTTTFYFKNVADAKQARTALKEHPLFDDVTPHTWR